MKVVDDLRAALKTSGKTHREIADVIGVSRVAVTNFVNGKIGLHPRNLEKILDYLGLKIVLVKGK